MSLIGGVGGPAPSPGLPLDLDVLLHHLGELLLVDFRAYNEFMLKKLRCCGSVVGVLHEALRDEVGEQGRPFASNRRRVKTHNVENDLTLALFDIGRVAIGQLVRENPQTPDIDLAIVLFLAFDQLWGHPAYSTHAASPMLSFTCELC